MQSYIVERTIFEAEYITSKKCTVRDCAKIMNVSKSTVHADMKERLPLLDVGLYKDVAAILGENFSVRHIRGGISTREKYCKLRNR